MSTPRRNKPIISAAGAVTPDFSKPVPRIAPAVPRSDTKNDVTWWKRLLLMERRRNGQVEGILTRTITNLEQQVEDLRGLYLRSITLKPTPKETTNKETK